MSKEDNNSEDLSKKDVDETASPEGGEELVNFVKEELGKEVDDPDKAKKMIKDTFSHVGKFGKYKDYIENLEESLGGENQAITMLKGLVQDAGEESNDDSDPIESLQNEVKSLKSSIEHKEFYSDNPEYKPYKKLINKFGDDPSKVVESEEFQEVYEKLQNQDEGNRKSVLHSNQRVGQASDKVSDSRDKLEKGDYSGAEDSAVEAVLESSK